MRKPRLVTAPAPAAPSLEPRWLRTAVIVLAGVFLMGLFSTEMADPDSWWHLRTGEYVLTQHRLPVPDPFAWTTAVARPAYAGEEITRRFNLTHEWLAQVLLYAVWWVGGFAAVVLVKALLLAGMCGCCGWVTARRTGDWKWGVAAALACSSLACLFTSDRPALVSFFLVGAFLVICERGRPLWLLPLLSVVWGNSHGGFFLGWMVCACYAAEALWRDRAAARRWLPWYAAAVLASGLNPNGFRVVQTLLLYRQSFLTSTLVEWTRPYFWGPPYVFDVLLYAAATALAVGWRKVRPADWLLFALFAAAALTAFRNLILIALLAPILIATYIPWKPRLPAAASYLAMALLAGGTAWGAAHGQFFQLRAAEWRYPAGAVQFLAEHRISAPLFNTYEYGGYLIFRGQRVFIDGRALSETVYQDYRQVLGSPPGHDMRRDTLARHGVGAILMNSFEYTSGVLYPLAISLFNQPEWNLVFQDPQSMLFLKDVPAGITVLDKRRIVDHLDAECTLHVTHDPEFPLCARSLGDFYLRSGDTIRARRALGIYLENVAGGSDPAAREAFQKLLGPPSAAR